MNINHDSQININIKTNNLPNECYSYKTNAMIVTGIAFAAIGMRALTFGISNVTTIVAPVTPLALLSYSLFPIIISPFMIAGGLGMVGAAVNFVHTNEIAQRYFNFAESQENNEIKLEYYSKAANLRHIRAIQKEYNIGKDLMLESPNSDEKKFEKALQILNQSITHTVSFCNEPVRNFLSLHPELSTQLKDEINAPENSKNISSIIDRYAREVIKCFAGGGYTIHWAPIIF